MTTRLSVTGDLLIWTIVNCHFYFEVAGIAAAESFGQVESFGVRMTHSKPPEQCKPEFCGFFSAWAGLRSSLQTTSDQYLSG